MVATGGSGHAAVRCLYTSVVTAGVRTQLLYSAGNWRVNSAAFKCCEQATLEEEVCYCLISSPDSELSPELCIRSLRSYNWQFTLQSLHLQQCELIMFVGLVFV